MVNETGASTPEQNMCDDAKTDARMNVLYSPFRKREVNPQDWDSKMAFWENRIMQYCLDCNSCVFSISKLQSAFVRKGRPTSCLETVLDHMLWKNEIMRLEDLLSKDPTSQSWSSWAVNSFVKTPIIWSFNKLKESLISKHDNSIIEDYVHLAVLKKYSKAVMTNSRPSKLMIGLKEVKSILGDTDDLTVKVVLHWLQLQGQATLATVNNKTIIKLSSGGEHVKPFSETDIGLYRLQQNEQTLMHMLEQLEKEKQEAEQEARNYLKKGSRQVAKTCLRKKKELEKCIEKRASALENVQVLLTRVKEAESDAEILESYRLGLSALKATLKDAGLSEDSVSDTMDQVHEVLEVHEEIKSALSEPVAASVDEDLEKELAEILAQNVEEGDLDKEHQDKSTNRLHGFLPDLPEPPSHLPTSSSTKIQSSVAQSPMQ